MLQTWQTILGIALEISPFLSSSTTSIRAENTMIPTDYHPSDLSNPRILSGVFSYLNQKSYTSQVEDLAGKDNQF